MFSQLGLVVNLCTYVDFDFVRHYLFQFLQIFEVLAVGAFVGEFLFFVLFFVGWLLCTQETEEK